jgi:WD40 repeat protein
MSLNAGEIAVELPRRNAVAFISYAREDRPFVNFLRSSLEQQGITVKGDWDLQPGVRYQEELHAAIISSDTFLFVITPSSIASEPCRLEVEFAAQNNKRLAPLVRFDVPDDSVYPALRPIQYIFMREADDLNTSLYQLETGIKTDLQWVNSHSYWLKRALEWKEKGNSRSSLLRGTDLRDAERWLASASSDATKDPRPTPLQTEFLAASRQDEKKRQRIVLGAVSTGLVVALILLVVAFLQYRKANRETERAKRSEAAANEALQRETLARKEAQDALKREKEAKDETQAALTRETKARQRAVKAAEAERKARAAEEVARQNAERATTQAVQNLSQAYVEKADRALREKDALGGELLLATALTLDDRADTREKLWEAKANGVRLSWTTPNRSRGYAVALTRDGAKVAAGCEDFNIRLWQPADGRLIHTLRGHSRRVLVLAFNHSQKLLASAGYDSTIRLWDINSGKEVRLLSGHAQPVTKIAFTSDDRTLVSIGKDGTVRVWNVADGRLVSLAHLSFAPLKVSAFSPDGRLLAYHAGDDNLVRIFHVETGKELPPLQGHETVIDFLAFSPASDRLVSQDHKGVIRMWNVRGQSFSFVKQTELNHISNITFSADGRSLAAYYSYRSNDYLRVWDILTDREIHRFRVDTSDTSVDEIKFSADGKWMATAGDMTRLWRLDLNKEVLPMGGHGRAVVDLAYSPDGRFLASVGMDNTVRLWDARSGALFRGFSCIKCSDVVFSPDATILAVNNAAGRVRLWDVETGTDLRVLGDNRSHYFSGGSLTFSASGDVLYEVVQNGEVLSWPVRPKKSPVIGTGVATSGETSLLSPDGTMIAVCDRKRIKLLNLITNVAIVDKEQEDNIKGLAFTADGSLLAVANDSGIIRVWATENGQEFKVLRSPGVAFSQLAFSQDGQRLAAAGHGEFNLWNVESGIEIVKLNNSRNNRQWHSTIAFSPDGRQLAVGSDDNVIRVWTVENTDALTTLRGHRNYIRGITYSSDGRLLLTYGLDQEAQLWNVSEFQNSRLLRKQSNVQAAGLSPDGQLLALVTNPQTVNISDAATGQQLFELKEETGDISRVAFSEDGRLASLVKLGDTDDRYHINIWDLMSKRKLFSLPENQRVECLAFAPKGVNLLATGGAKSLRLWNLESEPGVTNLKAHGGTVTAVVFSSDGKRLASSSRDRTVQLWNVQDRTVIQTYKGHDDWVEAVAFSPDHRMLASASTDRTLRFWNIETGQELFKLPIPAEGGPPNGYWLRNIAFNPKQPVVAVSTGGFSVRLWDMNILTHFFQATPKKLLQESEQQTGLRVSKLDVIQ